MEKPFFVWEGVYSSFDEAPACGPGFGGSVWLERSLAMARQSLDALRKGETLDFSLRHRNAVLPALICGLANKRQRLRVLDFGGGLGFGYMHLVSVAPNLMSSIDYSILETAETCQRGRALFGDTSAPKFLETWPKGCEFDIIYTSSTIQYVNDWASVVAKMATYRPRFMVFSDLFVGDVHPFVTLQNYYDSKICHWILSTEEFVDEVQKHGYELRYKGICEVKVLGKEGPLPMDNLPGERRLKNTVHLVFANSSRDAT